MNLKWTKEVPDCEGWWWFRGHRRGVPKCVRARLDSRQRLLRDGSRMIHFSTMYGHDSEWSDKPIPTPDEGD